MVADEFLNEFVLVWPRVTAATARAFVEDRLASHLGHQGKYRSITTRRMDGRSASMLVSDRDPSKSAVLEYLDELGPVSSLSLPHSYFSQTNCPLFFSEIDNTPNPAPQPPSALPATNIKPDPPTTAAAPHLGISGDLTRRATEIVCVEPDRHCSCER